LVSIETWHLKQTLEDFYGNPQECVFIPIYRTRAIISRDLYFFYPFFTAAAAYTAERALFLDSFFPSGIALFQFDFTSI
jgi:hypothetical protein